MRRIVVFRHGIAVNRWFMEPLARFLHRRGFEVRNRSYRTTRKTIEEHAENLASELREIASEAAEQGGEWEIDAVAHSMGSLVLRYALTRCETPRLRRAVLIAPPNAGSVTARKLGHLALYRWIFGTKAGAQLSAPLPGIFEKCGEPEGTEIGIVAGVGGRKLYPVAIPKPHDGVVALEEARLGQCPVVELPYNHTTILFHRAAQGKVASFLETGRFD